jgi:hypothetical protein
MHERKPRPSDEVSSPEVPTETEPPVKPPLKPTSKRKTILIWGGCAVAIILFLVIANCAG